MAWWDVFNIKTKKDVLIDQQKKAIAELNNRTFVLEDENKKLQQTNNELHDELLKVKELLEEPIMETPEFIDTNIQAYKPIVVGEGETVIIQDPRDIYAISPTLEKWIINNGIHKMTHDEKLRAIWKFVIEAITYKFDKAENWQFPAETYYRKYGDCEDGTILFVVLCRAAGIKPDKVFNACGWVKTSNGQFGHSYPIAQMSDGFYYIFETTIDYVPTQPMRFKGSNYDSSWGVANWLFSGGIKNGQQNNYQI